MSMSDDLQDKIDQIDILETNLDKERARLQQSLKDLSDLREDLDIANQRLMLKSKEYKDY